MDTENASSRQPGFVVVRLWILVEADLLRLARLALDATRTCGGNAFSAAETVSAVLARMREARVTAGGALEVRLMADEQQLYLDFAEQRHMLSEIRAMERDRLAGLAARLRDESESRDAELLWQQNREAARIAAAQAEALEALEKSLLEKRQALAEATLQADTDPLTGLYNRRAYDARLDQAVAEARSGARPLALLFLDLDHFKDINDSEGHGAGDRHLQRVGAVLQTALADSGDSACRTGGDEFAVIMAAPLGQALEVAQGVIKALDGGVSIGLSLYRQGDTAQTLASRADQALYRAKGAGRGQVMVI